MGDTIDFKCSSCGAPLSVGINCSRVTCKYCGAENIIPDNEVSAKFKINNSTSFESKTDIDNVLKAIKYNIINGNFEECDRLIQAGIITFGDDYRLYGLKAIECLYRGNVQNLFNGISMLVHSYKTKSNENDFKEMCKSIVNTKGRNGVQLLHLGVLYRNINIVEFCLDYGADVESTYCGHMPIELLKYTMQCGKLVYIDKETKKNVSDANKAIKSLLIEHGAKDRSGNILTEHNADGSVTVRSAVIWMLMFMPAGIYKLCKANIDKSYKLVISILCILVVGVSIGVNVSYRSRFNSGDTKFKVGSGVPATISEIYDARDVPGSISADTYDNKVCTISGKVLKIEYFYKRGNICFVVDIYSEESPFETIRCYGKYESNSVNLDGIRSIHKDDYVTMTGICEISSLSIRMRGCSLATNG